MYPSRGTPKKPQPAKPRYYLLHKPYGVLSQFAPSDGRPGLSSIGSFPKDVYPVGRLDMDSEGLLLLTNDKTLTAALMKPEMKQEKEYFVLVEGFPSDEALRKLQTGVLVDGTPTLPAKAVRSEEPEWVQERVPPPSLKPSLRYSWLSLIIVEGRNRQVRKMCAAVGHPVMRLIRFRVGPYSLERLPPGEYKEISLRTERPAEKPI